MIKASELIELIEVTGLTRQKFSLKLNRSPNYINIYLCQYKNELPIKSCCLIAFYFKAPLRKIIGKERVNSILEISKRVNFKPLGEVQSEKTNSGSKKIESELPCLVIKESSKKVINANNCDKFTEITKSLRLQLKKDHPKLEKNMSTIQLNYIVGRVLREAGVGKSKLIEIKSIEK